MPIEPANEVKIVRAFLVFKLLKLKESAVKKDIETLFFVVSLFDSSSSTQGSVSLVILPSNKFTTLVEYFSASSGL